MMAFEMTNLSCLSYTLGFTIWHYKTADNMKNVMAKGYIRDEMEMINVGDVIIINSDIHETIETKMVSVISSFCGNVEIKNLGGANE